jgi:hypothetical protein
MFSKKQIKKRRDDLLKNLTKLSSEETQQLSDDNKIITSGTHEEKIHFSKNQLADYSRDIVFKYCANSQSFREFCDNDQYPHFEKWRDLLQKNGYPSEKIISVDGKDSCSVLDQYLGTYFMQQYNQYKKDTKSMDSLLAAVYLDLACGLGVFHALASRCQLNQAKIKSATVKDDEETDARAQLREDAKVLANLYWALGGSVAYPILLDIGNYYANKNDSGLAAIATTFQEDAAAIFLWAKELASYKPPLAWNIKVAEMIYGKARLAQFANIDWDGLKGYILTHVDDGRTPHTTFCLHIKNQVNEFVSNRSKRSQLKQMD